MSLDEEENDGVIKEVGNLRGNVNLEKYNKFMKTFMQVCIPVFLIKIQDHILFSP